MFVSLYETMYNMIYTFMYKKNICCYYILSCIMKNKYCHYTSSRIIRYTISCMTEIFLALIYTLLYNEK